MINDIIPFFKTDYVDIGIQGFYFLLKLFVLVNKNGVQLNHLNLNSETFLSVTIDWRDLNGLEIFERIVTSSSIPSVVHYAYFFLKTILTSG